MYKTTTKGKKEREKERDKQELTAAQEDDLKTLHMISSFLLFDGRQNESTFHAMNEEGSFPRLLELLQTKGDDGDGDSTAGLHRLLMDLLYEMSRVQRVRIEDLVLVDDDFVRGLFGIIENLSYDVNDPYHYPVIRVLVSLPSILLWYATNVTDRIAGVERAIHDISA